MGLFTHGYGHAMRGVGGLNLGRGTIIGGLLPRFSAPNMPYLVNSIFNQN